MMPEAVVDVFETIQINESNRKSRAKAGRGQQGLLQAVVQQPTVGQSGERVVVGLTLDAGLIEAALGDVFDSTLVGKGSPVLAEHQSRVLRDPDDVAVLAIHLGLKAGDRAARLHDAHEFLASLRVDVELPAYVAQ